MRTLLLCMALLFFPPLVSAKTDCTEEAQQLAALLESEIPGLLAEKQQRAEAVLQKACEDRREIEQSEKKDAFTELLFSGEGGDKPGNKRLKRKSP